MARLRSARLTNDTLLSQIDDYVGELESDVAEILGITLDEDVTESALGLSNAGLVTKDLLRFCPDSSSPITEDGVRTAVSIENSTNSNVMYVGFFDNTGASLIGFVKSANPTFAIPGLCLYPGTENAGGLDDPYWQLFGATYTSAQAGLVPDGYASTDYYWGTDGLLHIPGRPNESCLIAGASTTGNTGTPIVPTFSTDIFDAQGLHAASDDEIIIVNAGNYIVGWSISVDLNADSSPGHATIALKRDRSAVVTTWAQADQEIMTTLAGNFQGQALVPCNASDKLSLSVNATVDSGSDHFHIDGTFWAARIS